MSGTVVDPQFTWPLPHPVGPEETRLLQQALTQADWSHSETTERFERQFAAFMGTRHAMMVPSGTVAVQLALVAAGIEPGQEVIVPGLTWPSVVYAIAHAGGVPRPVDIDPHSLVATEEAIADAITDRTFAVLATHLFGSQVDMAVVAALAERRGVVVVEDAAQSLGSVQNGRHAGTWGLLGAFSLNDRKILTCGEGGVVITDSDAVHDRLRVLQLIQPDRTMAPDRLPGTYKVSDFQSAVALGQLGRLAQRLEHMSAAAELLRSRLQPYLDRVRVQAIPQSVDVQSYFNFCMVLERGSSIELSRALSKRLGLRVSRPYRPLARIPDFESLRGTQLASGGLMRRLDQCDRAFDRTAVRLPHRVLMASDDVIDRLADVIIDEIEVMSRE